MQHGTFLMVGCLVHTCLVFGVNMQIVFGVWCLAAGLR